MRTKQRPETPVTENKSPAKCGSLPSNQGTERVQGNVVRDAVEAHTCTAHVRHRSTPHTECTCAYRKCTCAYRKCACAYRKCACAYRKCACAYRKCACAYRKCACANLYITIQHVHTNVHLYHHSNKISNHTKKKTHKCKYLHTFSTCTSIWYLYAKTSPLTNTCNISQTHKKHRETFLRALCPCMDTPSAYTLRIYFIYTVN